jgi:hypothetical protein
MSDTPNCWSCRFWYQPTPDEDGTGQCRRSPPVSDLLAILDLRREQRASGEEPHAPFSIPANWPGTWHDDFCGEFQPRPEASP